MKILFNCSTNFVGGGVQTATNFILQAAKDNDIEWHIAASSVIFNQIRNFGIEVQNIYVFEVSPARNKKEQKRLLDIEKTVKPDLVYTMSGPAYVNFKGFHILGFSDADIIYRRIFFFEWIHSYKKLLKDFLLRMYKMYFFYKADFWIFQTEASRTGFVKRFRIKGNRTAVVPNACGSHYQKKPAPVDSAKRTDMLSFFVPSADFPHKNLDIILWVAKKLKAVMPARNINKKFEFIFTLPENGDGWSVFSSKAKELDIEENIKNNGPFSVYEGPSLYEKSFAVFLPTLLETFSAVFVESMATGTLLIVSDRDFARDICKNAAIYFEPTSIDSAVEAIVRAIAMDDTERLRLIDKGFGLIDQMPDVAERYEMIKGILVNKIREGK